MIAVTSFKALPARNRCRFFLYEVFFFGTALSMPCHISASNPGRLSEIAGNDIDGEGEGLSAVSVNREREALSRGVWRRKSSEGKIDSRKAA